MLFSLAALLCLSRSLLAVELVIYKSFTEVRQVQNGIGEYRYEFPNSEYGNIIDGSISWEGTPFLRQEVFSSSESLQNAQVTVRRSTVCECETVQAKIIDPTSMLLQNLKTGSYFYADKQSVEYLSTQPDNQKTSLVFQFKDNTSQRNGTLSYLVKGITWTPNYDLAFTKNNDCELRAYANIKNEQQREYTVDNTYLLGGDVQLATSYLEPVHRFEASKAMSNSRLVQFEGERKGLYSYSVNDKYTLRPSSSVRLPFIQINPKCKFYYKVLANIAAGQSQGVFGKTYDITPDHFMPAGVVTVRDNHVLVGQANLPDIPENYTQTVTLGQDNDVRYSIKANLTSQSDEKATIQLQNYELDVQIKNFKNKNVDAQFILSGGLQITLRNSTCKNASVNGNQLNLPLNLDNGQNLSCKFSLTVRTT